MLSVAKDAGKTCQRLAWKDAEKAQFLVNLGRARARQGDFGQAIATFQQAQKLLPRIEVPAEDRVKQWAAEGSIEQGENLVKEGKVQQALMPSRQQSSSRQPGRSLKSLGIRCVGTVRCTKGQRP